MSAASHFRFFEARMGFVGGVELKYGAKNTHSFVVFWTSSVNFLLHFKGLKNVNFPGMLKENVGEVIYIFQRFFSQILF